MNLRLCIASLRCFYVDSLIFGMDYWSICSPHDWDCIGSRIWYTGVPCATTLENQHDELLLYSLLPV